MVNRVCRPYGALHIFRSIPTVENGGLRFFVPNGTD
jgi:hypothetical protein